MTERVRVVVTGAGGFIGSHLVKYLKRKGYWVRGVDVKHPEIGSTEADEFKNPRSPAVKELSRGYERCR